MPEMCTKTTGTVVAPTPAKPGRPDPHADLEGEFVAAAERCKPYTMTSIERMYALWNSVRYLVKNRIPGDLVECGVWKGGSAMVAALALQKLGDTARKIYLYDTYEGMPEPSERDLDYRGAPAHQRWAPQVEKGVSRWCNCAMEEARRNLLSTGFAEERLVFVKGKVEETIPRTVPERIALLRLDTDWHASTYHELQHLYPRVTRLGVIIIDDYGHWQGCRDAVDQYLKENHIPLLLNRIDYTGRIAVKV